MTREQSALRIVPFLIGILRCLCRLADILTTKQHFARHDIVVGKLVGVLNHIHEREENRRAAYTGLAVNMNPSIFRQFLVDGQEFIDICRGRCRVVHDRHTIVLDAHRFDELFFGLYRIDMFDLLRSNILVLVQRSDINILVHLGRFEHALLAAIDFLGRLTFVEGFVARIPADAIIIDVAMRFIAQIDDDKILGWYMLQ